MASEPLQLTAFDHLVALMNRDGVFHQVHPDDKSVRIPTKKGALEGLLIVRWQDRDGVLQFIHPLPVEVAPGRLGAVESAITRVNHALALPGFGFNHDAGLLYFRVTAPLPPEGVSDRLVQALFRATVRTSADFFPALKRVAQDGGNPETVIADAQIDVAMSAGQVPSA